MWYWRNLHDGMPLPLVVLVVPCLIPNKDRRRKNAHFWHNLHRPVHSRNMQKQKGLQNMATHLIGSRRDWLVGKAMLLSRPCIARIDYLLTKRIIWLENYATTLLSLQGWQSKRIGSSKVLHLRVLCGMGLWHRISAMLSESLIHLLHGANRFFICCMMQRHKVLGGPSRDIVAYNHVETPTSGSHEYTNETVSTAL